jgi:hypothetical protein
MVVKKRPRAEFISSPGATPRLRRSDFGKSEY